MEPKGCYLPEIRARQGFRGGAAAGGEQRRRRSVRVSRELWRGSSKSRILLHYKYGNSAAVYPFDDRRSIHSVTIPHSALCMSSSSAPFSSPAVSVGSPEADPHPHRTIVLVGLMGAGKSSIGRRLAQRLGLPFVDADKEIEAAAGCSIEEIFERLGEAAFRDGERRVILRLLDDPVHVLSTGGGAFMDAAIRARVKEAAVSVWLRADLDLLVRRVSRRSNRPLLKQGDPRDVLARLIDVRHPMYAQADICVDSADGPPELMVQKVIDEIQRFATRPRGAEATP